MVEALKSDVIHVYASMHARAHIGFGDDENLGFVQEGQYLRGHRDKLTVALQHAHLAVPQHAQGGVMPGFEVLSVYQLVIAHSQEGEIVGHQPLQECNRFRCFAWRQRMRIASKLLDQGADSRQYRFPIGDRTTYLFQHLRERGDDGITLGIILDALEMQINKAFAALQLRARAEGDEATSIIAGNVDDRMGDEAHRDFSFREIRQDGRHEEWHIVVDDLQNRDIVSTVAFAIRFAR